MPRDLSQFLDEVLLDVTGDEDGLRLDHFLGDRIFWRSRTDLQKRIKAGRIEVNGTLAKASLKLHPGDQVRIAITRDDLPDQDPAAVDLHVLREDEHLIAIDKQAGLVVHPTGRHVYDTLMNALFLRFRESGELDRGIAPHVVHRLDRNTSGVIVVAKSFAAKQRLQDEFESRRPRKTYVALVEGVVGPETGTIDAPLARDDDAEIRLKMAVTRGGLPSETDYEIVERFAEHTLVHARPHTGRQHQIRVHLAFIGHPIVADPLYGDPRSVGLHALADPLLDRQALHAVRLEIAHPMTGETMALEAPLAVDMCETRDALRRGERLTRLADTQSSRWS